MTVGYMGDYPFCVIPARRQEMISDRRREHCTRWENQKNMDYKGGGYILREENRLTIAVTYYRYYCFLMFFLFSLLNVNSAS